MNTETRGVVLCGVGGQGVVLLSDIFTEGLMEYGYDVKKSEQHGMSQRNGSVNAQIKFGKTVYAPVLSRCSADAIVAFEKAEALRWLSYLKKGGCLIVNDLEIAPIEVQLGKESYPENLSDRLRAEVPGTILIRAIDMAASLGTTRAQSMLLLGILVKKLELMGYDWEAKVMAKVPKRYVDANIAALRLGLDIADTKEA